MAVCELAPGWAAAGLTLRPVSYWCRRANLGRADQRIREQLRAGNYAVYIVQVSVEVFGVRSTLVCPSSSNKQVSKHIWLVFFLLNWALKCQVGTFPIEVVMIWRVPVLFRWKTCPRARGGVLRGVGCGVAVSQPPSMTGTVASSFSSSWVRWPGRVREDVTYFCSLSN